LDTYSYEAAKSEWAILMVMRGDADAANTTKVTSHVGPLKAWDVQSKDD